ncbi:MAG: hypothetical protein N2517_09190 [Ignavibacteria bacterium]|nr:hypothetical protein [Ignavibacteria bacterium]
MNYKKVIKDYLSDFRELRRKGKVWRREAKLYYLGYFDQFRDSGYVEPREYKEFLKLAQIDTNGEDYLTVKAFTAPTRNLKEWQDFLEKRKDLLQTIYKFYLDGKLFALYATEVITNKEWNEEADKIPISEEEDEKTYIYD